MFRLRNTSWQRNLLQLPLHIASGNTSLTNGDKYDILINPVEVGGSYLPYGNDYGFTVTDLTVGKELLICPPSLASTCL